MAIYLVFKHRCVLVEPITYTFFWIRNAFGVLFLVLIRQQIIEFDHILFVYHLTFQTLHQ